MKKLARLLLAAALMLAMTSCGGNNGSESSSDSSLPSLDSSESSSDSSLDQSETSSESESSASDEESSSESSSDKESSTSSSPASKPAQNKPSTPSKPNNSSNSSSSSKPAESSKPESQSPSSKPQEPPIPKPPASSSTPSSDSKPSVSVDASAVYDAMDRAIVARHKGVDAAIMNLPMAVDDNTLTDAFGISVSDVVSYKGTYAGSMTNCDIMLVVEAKDGKADTVKKALQDKQAAQKKQFEHYGVMGNIERLDASKVVSNGNFVALLIVGVMGDGEETYDCAGDVSAASSAFTNSLKK